ncbi:MAG: type II toxin-antitoxin system RelE/ParE family toxin [Phenylobacterium sp.]|nr:type II toxin-antitoxin system RelE/ParE family toxin [Phenylobacterium sp.]
MRLRRVVYAPEAEADLIAIYDWIADMGGPGAAQRFIDEVQDWIEGFDLAGERGSRRDDIRPGLRIVGFRQRITLAFAVVDDEVRVLRIFYAGQDWAGRTWGSGD